MPTMHKHWTGQELAPGASNFMPTFATCMGIAAVTTTRPLLAFSQSGRVGAAPATGSKPNRSPSSHYSLEDARATAEAQHLDAVKAKAAENAAKAKEIGEIEGGEHGTHKALTSCPGSSAGGFNTCFCCSATVLYACLLGFWSCTSP